MASKLIVLDEKSGVSITRGGASAASLLRIGLGLLYFWAFLSVGFGIGYTNTATSSTGEVTHGWHFSYDSNAGWISSDFKTSPTEGFVSATYGPVAPLLKNLPVGVDDFFWTFALAGLGIALTLGIFMRIAGWGGFVLNLMIWFSLFPPTSNPIIDGEHMAFAFGILLLMFLHAGNHWGLGRWWSRRTPALLN